MLLGQGNSLIRRRRSSVWLPPGYDPTHTLFTATPGYVYSDTAGTVPATGASDAVRSWRARNGTLAVFNANVAWDGVSKFTLTGTQYATVLTGVARTSSETVVVVHTTATKDKRIIGTVSGGLTNRLYYSGSPTKLYWQSVSDVSVTTPAMGGVACTVVSPAASTVRLNGTEVSGAPITSAGTGLVIGGHGTTGEFIGTFSAFYLAPNRAFTEQQRIDNEAWFQQKYIIEPAVASMEAFWTLDDDGGLVDTIGGLTLTPQGTVGSAAGVIGQARSFAGEGYLTTPNIPILQPAIGLAYECWVYPTQATADFGIVGTDNNTAPRGAWLYQKNTDFRFLLNNTVPATTIVAAGITLTLNTWYHVVGTIDVDRVPRIYVNGVLKASGAALASLSTGTALQVGRWSTNVLTYFKGRIDELAIYQFGASGDPGAAYWLWRYNNGAGRRP